MKQIERSRHPQILTRTAFVHLAPVTRERVERAGTDGYVLVVEREDEVGEGRVVHEAIEDVDALAPHNGLAMSEPSPKRGQC